MNSKLKLNLCAFATVFLWATAFPLTKIVSCDFSPYSLGLIRCTVASVILIILGRFLHIRKPMCKKDIILLTITGILGFSLYMILFNTGILTITSATSSVVIASTPIMTAIVTSVFYNEKISKTGWLAIFMAFTGVVILLFWKGILSVNIGILWTLAASVVFCGYNILNRKLSAAGYTSLEIVTYAMISGAAALIFFAPEAVSHLSGASGTNILAVIALGIFPSATSYFLWAKALELADKTNEVTNYMFITPLLSTIMGFLMLGEIPDAGTLIGGIIIISSLILFSFKGK